jgi:hypothetical protein
MADGTIKRQVHVESRKRGQTGGLSPCSAHDRVAPFVSPVASDAGAVMRDAVDFDAARAVSSAFAEGDPTGGLTLADIRTRVEVEEEHVLDDLLHNLPSTRLVTSAGRRRSR